MPCTKGTFTMTDKSGSTYRLECDNKCRNHLFSAHDVCVLPNLAWLANSGLAGIRIEAQREEPEVVELLVRTYRKAIDAILQRTDFNPKRATEELERLVQRPMSDGAFGFEMLSV